MILLLSQLFAQLSDRMASLGLIWFITDHFGEKWVTGYLILGGLPHLLFAGWNGRVIRKIGALKTVMGADWFRALIYFIPSLLISTISGPNELFLIMTLVFITNCFAAFFNPAILSLPVELEEEGERVQKLTARLSTVSSLTIVLGPIMGIFCFQWLGLRGLFISNTLAYLASGFCAWLISKRPLKLQEGSLDSQSKSPVSIHETLKSNSLVASMLLVFLLMNFLSSPMLVQIPYLAKNIFSGSFNSMALMEVGLGIGIVLGGLILSVISITQRNLFYSWFFLIGIGTFFLSFQYSSRLWMATLSLFFVGLFVGLVNILIINLFQTHARQRDIPNIMSLVNLIGAAAVPLSLISVAAAQTVFNIIQIGWFCGIILFLVCLFSAIPFRKWGKEYW